MTLRRIRAVARKEIIQILRDPRSLHGRALHAAHADGAARLRGQHGHQARADLRVRSRGQPAERGAAQGVPGFAIFRHRRDRARLRRRLPGRSTRAAARWRSSSRTISRETSPTPTPLRCRRSSTPPTTTPPTSRSATLRRWSATIPAMSSSTRTQSMGLPQPVVPAVAQYRVWYNEDLVSRNYIMPGVVALVMALVGAQLTSLTISREWERGTMEVLVSTPVTRMELMAGKILPYFFIGLIDAALCLLIAVFWFEAPFRGAVSTLFVCDAALPRSSCSGSAILISASDPQPARREQIALVVDAAADEHAFGLRLSDRPDADTDPVADLSRSGAVLFRDPEIGVPQGQRAQRPDRADRFARALRRGHRALSPPGRFRKTLG